MLILKNTESGYSLLTNNISISLDKGIKLLNLSRSDSGLLESRIISSTLVIINKFLNRG